MNCDNDESQNPPAPSLGQARCFVTYKDDPVQQELILSIREKGSEWIDALETIKKSSATDGENFRLYALAQTTIEEAVMWSIKAICK